MRKQLVIITMAVIALLTAQCKKNEPKPGEKVMVPITGTVDFGGSKTEITTTGCINPVVGDKIYIYHSGQNVGYVNCTATSGQQFSCSGEIDENCLGTTCTFMYLGSGSTDAAGNSIDGSSTTISFADQTSVSVTDGKIANMNKFHVGSCTANVSQEGTVTLSMLSKMAIAYFQLKDDSGSPIANKNVTISGLSATATINKTDGSLTGNSGNITVKTDANGSFYMALIPQGGPVEFAFIFAGYEGTRAFSNGIRECNFYSEQGLGSPLQVTLAYYVDLGLPSGTLWATCNVGADSPEEYGDYFAWGETTPNFYFDWTTYMWCNGDYNKLTKYCTKSNYGAVDNKTVLELEDDAARANWGGAWRMPTHADIIELITNCTSEWTTQKGVRGRKFTGSNGNSIFLPAAGHHPSYLWGGLDDAGSGGYYWSSSLYTDCPYQALDLRFSSDDVWGDSPCDRNYGWSVRPVCPSQK